MLLLTLLLAYVSVMWCPIKKLKKQNIILCLDVVHNFYSLALVLYIWRVATLRILTSSQIWNIWMSYFHRYKIYIPLQCLPFRLWYHWLTVAQGTHLNEEKKKNILDYFYFTNYKLHSDMMTQITLFIPVTCQEEISNTRKFDFFMNRLNMSLQISLWTSLMIA